MNQAPENQNQADVPPEVRRKAQRTIWILYAVMAVMILLPFVMLFFR